MEAPAVIIIDPKYPHNVRRHSSVRMLLSVKSLIWTGGRVNPAKYSRLPREEHMKGYKHVDFRNDERPFELLPKNCVPVCVEVFENSEPLTTFEHPENAVYVFGPEDGRVPQVMRQWCHRFVHIPAHFCLNLSASINVVLAHRLMSRQLAGKMPILPLREMLHEVRGREV